MLDLMFRNELYPTGLNFNITDGYPSPSRVDGAVLTIPGAYWREHYVEINEALSRYRWVLGIKTSDEEDLFDIRRVNHKNIRWWVQTPRADRDYGSARLFGVGYTPHFNQLPKEPPVKELDVFLSAQRTHKRRELAFEALQDIPGGVIRQTPGFTEGMKPEAYAEVMCSVKVAPAPSGAVSPDSFRVYEALEAHCIPIADDVSPVYDSAGYWRMLFGGEPFPILENYTDLRGYIEDQLTDWTSKANRCAASWMRYKRTMTHWLREDLEALGAL
jgi:hypothetical protein